VKIIYISIIILLLVSCKLNSAELKNGDFIFHESLSTQSRALKYATGSRYTHVGIIYIRKGKPYVYEAIGPVKLTPLDSFIRRGVGGHYVVKRLKYAEDKLTPENIKKLKAQGRRLKGLPYDPGFMWSDNRIYCSELVWKIYKRSMGIEIGKLLRYRDFNLSHHVVEKLISKRFGKAGVPLDEPVISPGEMFRSDKLRTVLVK